MLIEYGGYIKEKNKRICDQHCKKCPLSISPDKERKSVVLESDIDLSNEIIGKYSNEVKKGIFVIFRPDVKNFTLEKDIDFQGKEVSAIFNMSLNFFLKNEDEYLENVLRSQGDILEHFKNIKGVGISNSYSFNNNEFFKDKQIIEKLFKAVGILHRIREKNDKYLPSKGIGLVNNDSNAEEFRDFFSNTVFNFNKSHGKVEVGKNALLVEKTFLDLFKDGGKKISEFSENEKLVYSNFFIYSRLMSGYSQLSKEHIDACVNQGNLFINNGLSKVPHYAGNLYAQKDIFYSHKEALKILKRESSFEGFLNKVYS